MKVVSFHPSKKAASEFAEGLIGEGAQAVRVGIRRLPAGYPVTSEIERTPEVEEFILESEQSRERIPVTEKYEYDAISSEPVSWTESMLMLGEQGGKVSRRFTRGELAAIARDELRKLGVRENVKVTVSRYHGRDPDSPYADATVFGPRRGPKGREWLIRLHPINQYRDEEYIRDVIRHEVGQHIRGER